MNVQKLTAQMTILGLLHLSLAEVGKAAPRQTDLKQRVEQFGVGTELKVKLKNGEKLRGSVDNIGDDSFVLTSKDDSASRQIAFNDLGKVSYPKRGYKAEGAPHPAAAKRMVVQLGVGEHIMVQISPTEKVHGHIREIHDNHFVILPDGQTSTLDVPYDSIRKVNKNLSFGATIVILAGIAVAAVLILVLTGKDDILPK
jgi:ribosome maturation factor RimP